MEVSQDITFNDLASLTMSTFAALPSMLVAGTAEHARVRRLFSPAFSDRALKQQQSLFSRYADLLSTNLLVAGGQPVDMTKMFNLATFDIMAEYAFGEPLGLLQNNRYTPWYVLPTAIRFGYQQICLQSSGQAAKFNLHYQRSSGPPIHKSLPVAAPLF